MASDLTDLLSIAASSANIMQQEYTPTFQPTQQQQQQYSTPQYSTPQYSTQQQQPQQQYQQQEYQQYKACENHKLLTAILQELTTLSRSMVKQEMNVQKELCVLQSSMLKLEHHFNKKMEKECVLKISTEPMIIPVQLQPDKSEQNHGVKRVHSSSQTSTGSGSFGKQISMNDSTKKQKK